MPLKPTNQPTNRNRLEKIGLREEPEKLYSRRRHLYIYIYIIQAHETRSSRQCLIMYFLPFRLLSDFVLIKQWTLFLFFLFAFVYYIQRQTDRLIDWQREMSECMYLYASTLENIFVLYVLFTCIYIHYIFSVNICVIFFLCAWLRLC